MTSPGDVEGEMRRTTTTDAVLSGLIGPEDAPPELQRLARLVQAARGPAESAELENEAELISSIAAAVRVASSNPAPGSRTSHHLAHTMRSPRAIALATLLVLGGGSAAAATGSLPVAIQRVVANTLRHVGISVPKPISHQVSRARIKTPKVVESSSTSTIASTPAGLCSAFEHQNHGSITAAMHSRAYAALVAAAAARGESVNAFCHRDVLPLSTTTFASSSTTASSPKTTAPAGTKSKGASTKSVHGASTPAGNAKHTPATTTVPKGTGHSSTPAKNAKRIATTTTSVALPTTSVALPTSSVPARSDSAQHSGNAISPAISEGGQ